MSDLPKPPPGVEPQIQIDIDEGTAQGAYSNLVLINHNENEFVLDFAYLQPAQPRARVRSRIISYLWDTSAPAGSVFKSEKTGLVTYVVVRSGPGDLGKWVTETRNVLEDYQKIYGEAPGEEVGAISISIDSNDTRSSSESYVAEILFRKP